MPAQNVATWTASPNPFRHRTTFTLATPVAPDTRTRLTVVDVAGRVVRRLTAVGARVTWDGSDESGRGVPAGVYFARSADGRAVRVLRLR